MLEKLEIFRTAGALAQHAGARQGEIARNIANADTPGYRGRDIAPFAETYRTSDDSFGLRRTRANHLPAPAGAPAPHRVIAVQDQASPNGNTVSLEGEMMKAVETRQQHDMALSVYSASLNILRTSLGRGR